MDIDQKCLRAMEKMQVPCKRRNTTLGIAKVRMKMSNPLIPPLLFPLNSYLIFSLAIISLTYVNVIPFTLSCSTRHVSRGTCYVLAKQVAFLATNAQRERWQPTLKQVYDNTISIIFVDPTCPTQNETRVAIDSRTDLGDEVNHDLSKTKETVGTVNTHQGTAGSTETCQSAPVHPEKTTCLTTIAEADSSVKTSPCNSAAFCGNKDPSQPSVVTTTHEKEDERAVSSTKFDSCPGSSLDTMQSVSILASLDYIAVPEDTLEDQQEGAGKDEDASNEDINEVSTKISGAEDEKEPFAVSQGQRTNDYQQSSQTVNKKLPSEIIMGSVEDHETRSLGFEGLDSLFDNRSLSKPVEASQKAFETGKKTVSPAKKGRDHQVALVSETTESDLYERVKQRRRRRPSEMLLQSHCRSDSPKLKCVQLKTKTRKRSADAVDVSTRIESVHDGNARKKLKNSEGPAFQHDSPLTVNAERSQDASGVSTECKEESDILVNGSKISCVKVGGNGQDGALSLGSHSCSSDNTVLSNEMVPASVSSSEKLIPPVINPMIAHVDEALEDAPRGSLDNANEWGSQDITEHDHGEITKNYTFVDDDLHKITTTEQSPQIKPIQVEQNRMNHRPKDKDKAYQGQPSDAESANSEISSPIQQLFSMALLVDGSQENGIPGPGEEKNAQLDDTERGGSSQVSVTGRQECLPSESSENALVTCDHQRPPFQEDMELTIQNGINDIQKLRNACSNSEPVPKQTQWTSSFNRHSQEEILPEKTGTSGSEIDGRLTHGTFEAGGDSSGPLSVEEQPLDNTSTQSSLDVIDAVTPCLFENESWETPNRKTSQKKSGNKRGPKIASDISRSNSKIVSRSSQTLGLSCETVIEEDKIVDTAGFEAINSLDGSPAVAKNAEQEQFSSVTCCSDSSIRELTSGTVAEGTQSYGTSQSISVLHDLEFPLPDPQEDADDACSEQRDDRGKSSQNVRAESKGDAPWAEPLPKKPRSREPLSAYRNSNPINVALDQGIGPSIEMTRDSEYTESDVIPPTPPVKPVSKQVFSSGSPMKLSSPKIKPQRKDGTTCHSERLVVNQKRLVKSTPVSNAVKPQDSEGNMAGTRCNATCSEDSVSLLKKHKRTPEAPIAQTIDASQTLDPDSSERLQSSPGKNGNKLENSPYESPVDLNHCVQCITKEQKPNNVSSDNINDSKSLQDKDDGHASQKEIQRVLANFEVKERTYSVERPLDEIQEESVISSPRNPVKRRVYDIADSFDWSGTTDKGEGNRNSQDGSVILIVDDVKDTERVKEDKKKDEALTDGFPESIAGKFQQNDDRDRTLVDVENGDFGDRGDDGSSPCTSDGGESSSDEALLKPVFLPKEFESGTTVTTYEEDAENEDEQEKAFSQELIPSENEDDDDDDGLICEYQYTFLIN